MKPEQLDLLERASALPEGFRYQPDLIDRAEERGLVERLRALPLAPFGFQGFLGKRRVLSFGWRYDYNGGGLRQSEPIPAFLLPLRERAAAFAGLHADQLHQTLLTEYPPGATIGWHKDRSVFADVVGISLLSACTFRLRRMNGARWQRASIVAEPRSVYLMRGASREEWEHSIPAVETTRYSITFRKLKAAA